MIIDEYGNPYYTEEESVELLYSNKNLDVETLLMEDPEKFNTSNQETYSDYPSIQKYLRPTVPVNVFHKHRSSHWFMPEEYVMFDIESYLLDQCDNEVEIGRMTEELSLFEQMDNFHILRFAKFFVDTLKKNNKVWGIGRGSSTASFALYKIGLHSINPIEWDIPITEFIKDY